MIFTALYPDDVHHVLSLERWFDQLVIIKSVKTGIWISLNLQL